MRTFKEFIYDPENDDPAERGIERQSFRPQTKNRGIYQNRKEIDPYWGQPENVPSGRFQNNFSDHGLDQDIKTTPNIPLQYWTSFYQSQPKQVIAALSKEIGSRKALKKMVQDSVKQHGIDYTHREMLQIISYL